MGENLNAKYWYDQSKGRYLTDPNKLVYMEQAYNALKNEAHALRTRVAELEASLETITIDRDVQVMMVEDFRAMLPYCEDCSEVKVGFPSIEKCPVCGLGPICEKCLEQHTTDVHVGDDPYAVLIAENERLKAQLIPLVNAASPVDLKGVDNG